MLVYNTTTSEITHASVEEISFWIGTGTNSIYYTGPVGIGTTSPNTGAALTIAGSVEMTGTLINPTLQSYKEIISQTGAADTYDIDWSLSNNHAVTISSNTSFSFSNIAATGVLQGMNLFLTQDSVGGRTASWPSSVTFGIYGTPTLSTGANATDVLNFITWTGGSKILGFLSGKNF